MFFSFGNFGAAEIMSTYLLIHHNIEISFQKFAWKSTEFACVGSRLCRFYIKKGRRFYESWVGYDDGRGWKVPANCDTLCRESRRWVRWLFGYINFERGGTVRSTVKLFTFFFFVLCYFPHLLSELLVHHIRV